MRRALATALLVCLVGAVAAADKPIKELHWETGKVTMGSGLASADLPEGYRYLQQQEARYVVEQVMHNPPDPETIGLIARAGDGDDGAFIAIVSYTDKDGHVKDDDASTINYDKLLKQLQDEATEAAPERRKQGYDGYAITGWAEAPHYDAATKKLYWAQNARFDGQQEDTLNYNVRLLGARGVLIINALGAARDLPKVAEGSKTVLAKTEFLSGNRYEDFKPGYDKVAAYGIGGLIATGLLAKAGFFAAIGKVLLPFIKWIVIGVVALGGAIARVLGLKKQKDPRDLPAKPPTAA
jgi:uncharacterized membrane-anchored protein